jgi:hypothetical protein
MEMEFQEVEFRDMNWIGLVQNRDNLQTPVNAVMNFRIP